MLLGVGQGTYRNLIFVLPIEMYVAQINILSTLLTLLRRRRTSILILILTLLLLLIRRRALSRLPLLTRHLQPSDLPLLKELPRFNIAIRRHSVLLSVLRQKSVVAIG